MKDRNVPKLRFKGFSDEWEEKKIGETLKIKHGKDQKAVVCENGEYPILATGGEIGRTNTPLYNKESVLIGRKGTIDKPVYMNSPFWTVDTLFYSEIKKNNFPKFIFYRFQCINWKMYNEASGVPSLSASTIESIKYKLPSINEQEKIANFLTKVDKIIEKQEEKVSSLEKYKKGMIQKIFSQEIRFKKDDGGEYPEWEYKKLGEVADNFDYGMNLAAIEFDGENKYIRITDIDERSNKYKKDNIVSPDGVLEDKYLVKENDILFARTGASVGKTYLYDKNDGKVYFAGFLIRAKINKSHNAKFIFLQTQTNEYKKWVEIMSMRSGQPGINSQEYATFEVKIPCIQEQIKIAKFLSKIDSIVEKEKEKLEELRVWKKGLLQRMFI